MLSLSLKRRMTTLANEELASGYTRLQPNAGDIWWHVCNINDRTMSYHEAPHKCTTILLGVARKKLQDVLLRAKRAARHGWDEADALRRMPVPGVQACAKRVD